MLFRENKGELKPIKQRNFALEKSLQTLVESNLKILFGLQFLESEFSLSGFRFDSVAFDEENRAFVITNTSAAKTKAWWTRDMRTCIPCWTERQIWFCCIMRKRERQRRSRTLIGRPRGFISYRSVLRLIRRRQRGIAICRSGCLKRKNTAI